MFTIFETSLSLLIVIKILKLYNGINEYFYKNKLLLCEYINLVQ